MIMGALTNPIFWINLSVACVSVILMLMSRRINKIEKLSLLMVHLTESEIAKKSEHRLPFRGYPPSPYPFWFVWWEEEPFPSTVPFFSKEEVDEFLEKEDSPLKSGRARFGILYNVHTSSFTISNGFTNKKLVITEQ